MGVDIHTFIEYKAGDKWEPLSMYVIGDDPTFLTSKKYYRVGPYEGRDSHLFDTLHRRLPNLGVPKDASKVFRQEWECYNGYNCNYILLSNLLSTFKKWEEIDFLNLQDTVRSDCELSLAEVTFNFVNSIFNYLSTLIDCQMLYLKAEEFQKELCNYRLIYFFDR